MTRDWDAATYDRVAGPQTRWGTAVLDRLALTGDERVKIQVKGSWGTGAFKMKYEGAINSMMRRMRETHSEEMRQHYR